MGHPRNRSGLYAVAAVAAVLGGCSAAPDCPPVGSALPAASEVASAARSHPGATTGPPKKLAFRKYNQEIRTVDLEALLKAIPAETITQYDPYYNRVKTFRALPLSRLVELGFPDEKPAGGLVSLEFVLRALDGYTVPLRGSKVFEQGAYVAFEDVEAPAWEPVGQQRANPGPFYLVWANKDQTDLETHPRPYQLASIEIASFESVFPRTVPTGVTDGAPAQKGFAIFREQCIHCHAVNRQGGRVGPELNLPRSIVEYRPLDQIKAYIRDPLSFRYSTMPAHPKLTEDDLENIVQYFTAMKDRKQDDPK